MSDERVAFEFRTAGVKTMADDTLRLSIDIEPRDAAEAFRVFGARGVCGAIAPIRPEAAGQAEPEETESNPMRELSGKFWRGLIGGGFFRAVPVCRALGTEKQFERWIRDHEDRSVLDGNYDWLEETGEAVCDPAHVRSVAEGAGTAERPPYFAVPLTHEQHLFQHQHGEHACLARFRPSVIVHDGDKPDHGELEAARKWFRVKADWYRTEWASRTLAAEILGTDDFESRSEAGIPEVIGWIDRNELRRFIPEAARKVARECGWWD